MASEKNLSAVFTDIANAIREKSGNTEQMQPINMADNIKAIKTSSLKNLLDTTKSCYYLFNNFKGTSVEGLISYSDTSNVESMSEMFRNCSNLITIPLLDTSKCLGMYQMFYCCSNLTTIPALDTSNVTNMAEMLYGCKNLTTIPLLDMSKVASTSYMFRDCSKLTTIPAFDLSHALNMNYMFDGCTSLKSILMTGMKVSFDISASTKFEESDLVTILNNLASVTSTQTLKMGATNLAKLTDEEKAIATNKGWTLA